MNTNKFDLNLYYVYLINMVASTEDLLRNKHVLIIDKEFNDELLSRRIEKQLYNASIRIAKERGMKRSWDNIVFKSLYISKIKSFYSNTAEGSYVNNPYFKEKILKGDIKV